MCLGGHGPGRKSSVYSRPLQRRNRPGDPWWTVSQGGRDQPACPPGLRGAAAGFHLYSRPAKPPPLRSEGKALRKRAHKPSAPLSITLFPNSQKDLCRSFWILRGPLGGGRGAPQPPSPWSMGMAPESGVEKGSALPWPPCRDPSGREPRRAVPVRSPRLYQGSPRLWAGPEPRVPLALPSGMSSFAKPHEMLVPTAARSSWPAWHRSPGPQPRC